MVTIFPIRKNELFSPGRHDASVSVYVISLLYFGIRVTVFGLVGLGWLLFPSHIAGRVVLLLPLGKVSPLSLP